MKTNNKIDTLLYSTKWLIDVKWGFQQLNRYLHQLHLIESGAQMSELGIGEMRKKSKQVSVIKLNQEGVIDTIFTDQWGMMVKETGDIPEGSLIQMSLSGPMFYEDDLCGIGMKTFGNMIREFDGNPNVSGILINAYSGGGESLAGQELYNAISDTSKPVVVYTNFLGSAATLGTAPADMIIAAGEFAEVGSIGGYISINKEFIEWYKNNVDDMYSNLSDDKNKAFRDYMNGDKTTFIAEVDEMVESFHDMMMQNRPLRVKVKDTLKGGMFAAKEAKKRGLVDKIGTYKTALQSLNKLTK